MLKQYTVHERWQHKYIVEVLRSVVSCKCDLFFYKLYCLHIQVHRTQTLHLNSSWNKTH